MSKEFDDFMDNVDKLGNEDVPKLGYDVEKLAEEEYPIFDGDLLGIAYNQKQSRIDFIKGYNKAIESQLPKHPSVISENGNELLFDKEGNLIKELPQQEISDEEIEKAAWKYVYDNKMDVNNIVHYIRACKWYREQLRKL
jgi:hypothetical protein